MDRVEIDIDEYGRLDKDVPRENAIYKFKVGNILCRWNEPEITGSEILQEARLLPVEQYQLNQRFRDGTVEVIKLDQMVDLCKHGLERFVYIKLDNTEGE